MQRHSQLVLPLVGTSQATFSNYYPGEHLQIIQSIQHLVTGGAESFIYLWGSQGAGRSHLLQAACAYAHERDFSAVYLPMCEHRQWQPSILEGMEGLQLICIDDIDQISGQSAWEEALFNLYNRIRDEQRRLLVAGNNSPSHIDLHLADLKSRLSWGLVYQLHPLNDNDKLNALQCQAEAKGLVLTETVAQFLLHRCSREMSTLFATLDRLDQASLQAQRRLTIPFVKEVLQV